MGTNASTVTGNPNDPTVTPVTGEVSAVSAETSQAGASEVAVTEQESFQERIERLEADRRKQQSIYDRMLSEEKKRNLELQAQLEEVQKRGMSEAERQAFEAQSYKTKYEQLVAEQQARQQMDDYASAFVQTFGVDRSKLDFTSPDALVNSGWQAAAERMAELQGRGVQQQPQQTPQRPHQTVITGSGGSPKTSLTRSELMKSIAGSMGKQSITLEEFWRYGERYPEVINQWLEAKD